jgi:2-keto-4-pentenoate hydratase/2-oxohepta-3-ene-1,7-dioic acid hydratase in catechol pathway
MTTTFARIDLGSGRAAFARADGDKLFLLRSAPWLDAAETGEVLPRAGARLLAPVTPTKIVCVGRNYRAHAAELGNEVPAEPLLFFKPPSSLVGPNEAIELPAVSERIDHEAELGVVIGERCRDVRPEDAHRVIFGHTCVNDVSARDLQKKDGQWTRAKGFDTFCPAGPLVVTGLDTSALAVRCRVSGAARQDGNTRDMIFSIPDLIAYISQVMTLEPGDLIATGTPHGVGPLLPGDVVEVEVEGIGTLRNPVRKR